MKRPPSNGMSKDTPNSVITDEAIAAYNRDGVIHVPNAISLAWLETVAAGIETNCREPGAFFRDQTRDGDPARYLFDFWTWRDIPEFREFVEGGPMTGLAAKVLGADQVTLLIDNWFMNEAGATNAAPWHQDKPYFDYEGRMCNILLALDSAPAEESLHFAKGSHRDDITYKAVHFRDKVPFDGQPDATYADMPDADKEFELARWALEPGDCLIFDLRTLHRGPSHGRPADSLRRRYSLRFGAPDTRFTPRGAWTEEITAHLESLGQKPGEILSTPLTPQLSAAAP